MLPFFIFSKRNAEMIKKEEIKIYETDKEMYVDYKKYRKKL